MHCGANGYKIASRIRLRLNVIGYGCEEAAVKALYEANSQ
jgi:hypothetical protein